MLIIPFENKLNWRKPPVMSLFLIAINCLVFFMYQTDDPERFDRAVEIYQQADFFELEKEAYLEYIDQEKKHQQNNQSLEDSPSDADTSDDMFIYQRLLTDLRFSDYLKKYWEQHPDKKNDLWVDTRKRFEEARNKDSVIGFGFTPANNDPVTVLTSMFLHGDTGHLIGNMVFLFIFGFALEVLIGRGVFLLLYLITGICAVYMFTAFNIGSFVPLVGASGAIAGLMGMYLAAYGLRKIRFFYYVGFYFGEFTAPAMMLFPYWIGKEIYAQYTTEDNVAYMAHAGGLLGGFLIVLILKTLGKLKVNTDYQDESEKTDAILIERLTSINQLFSELNTDRARSLCKKALEEYPRNVELWNLYYKLWKIEPKNKTFHEVTFSIFKLARFKDADMKFIGDILDSYLEVAPKPVALNGPVSVLLAQKFKKTGDTEHVEQLVNRAMQLNIISDAVFSLLKYLLRYFENKDDAKKITQYRKLVKEHYPRSIV